MTLDRVRLALDDALTFLDDLARDQVRPPEALARLGSLRRTHPELSIDLVWDDSPFAATVHYDALLRLPGAKTVSLSLCDTSDTPWPLRGARLASDQDLVRVNGETLKVRDAMDCIDFLWNELRIIRPLIDLCIVQEAVKRWTIEPAAEHRQRALDAFRSSRRLLSATDTLAWMAENELTQERLEKLLHAHAQAFALRDHVVTEGELEPYWRAHAGAFDLAHIARLRVRSRDRAQMFVGQIRQGRDFYAVLEEEFTARRLVALRHGVFESVRRRELTNEHAEAIFCAGTGGVAGPLASEAGFDIVRVTRTETASMDSDATRDAIRGALFERWLADQRSAARIEWFWGPAD